uniref:Elongation of fatty acids protein n=1 Tax=Parietichytrium sp. TaxID=1689869 RepID=A0A809VLV8_9STRA|nr:C20 elongase [Parietichytrium sp.]
MAARVEKQQAPAKAAKKVGSRVDRSDGFFRTFNLCALYGSAFAYAYNNGPVDNDGKGLYFSKSPFYAFLVSDAMTFGAPLMYVIAVMALSRYMADKQPLTGFIKSYIQPVYNIVQIVVCSWMAWGLLPQVDIFNLNPFGLNKQRDANIEFFVMVHLLTKFLDWTDTFIMIFKKNYAQVSFLQVFHHATIGMVWSFLLQRGWGSGTAAYGAFINSVTHVIMYTHYFVTSLNINNPFKRYITGFQLSQFASCIVHALLVLAFEEVYPLEYAYLQISYHIIMLYLFGRRMNWSPLWCTGEVDGLDVNVETSKKAQ